MKQVPNPLPKVLSRRGVGAGMEAAERESFERTQVGTRGSRGMRGMGIPGDAVCPRALKGVGVLQAQGMTGQGGREKVRLSWRPGKVGDLGIPAGLGEKGSLSPRSWHDLCCAAEGSRSRRGRAGVTGAVTGGRTEKGLNGRGSALGSHLETQVWRRRLGSWAGGMKDGESFPPLAIASQLH